MANRYFVYILECKDKSLYTGITTDIERRLEEHKSGRGASYTRAKGVKGIVFSESCSNRSVASKREAEIKKLKRSDKKALVLGWKAKND
jgi:putative endonuclease